MISESKFKEMMAGFFQIAIGAIDQRVGICDLKDDENDSKVSAVIAVINFRKGDAGQNHNFRYWLQQIQGYTWVTPKVKGYKTQASHMAWVTPPQYYLSQFINSTKIAGIGEIIGIQKVDYTWEYLVIDSDLVKTWIPEKHISSLEKEVDVETQSQFFIEGSNE